MIISLNTALDLKILSPSEPIGIFIIFVGLIFTAMIFYIIYAVSTNKESLEDKKIRTWTKLQINTLNYHISLFIVFLFEFLILKSNIKFQFIKN